LDENEIFRAVEAVLSLLKAVLSFQELPRTRSSDTRESDGERGMGTPIVISSGEGDTDRLTKNRGLFNGGGDDGSLFELEICMVRAAKKKPAFGLMRFAAFGLVSDDNPGPAIWDGMLSLIWSNSSSISHMDTFRSDEAP
jgi:hypothetical protein